MKNYTLDALLECRKADAIIWHLYADEIKAVEAILENRYWHYDKNKKMTLYTIDDLENAANDLDNVAWYADEDAYFDSMDDLLQFSSTDSVEARYFDYDAYHRDCMYDVTEASNGIILADW